MRGRVEVLKPGLLTTIQDLGRVGHAFYAIPRSGAMDVRSAKVALLLLGLSESNPLIECTAIAPHLKFHADGEIVLTGADFAWTINEEEVSLNQIIKIQSGDMLRGKNATNGLRGYIGIKGEIEAEAHFGSYSTYTKASLGGIEGRSMGKGDIIYWSKLDQSLENNIFQVLPGPEFNWLTDAGRSSFLEAKFEVSRDTDRMGMRLLGPKIDSKAYQLKFSAPVFPGFIQLPPSGQPIIVLQDGQTTGGYPRIAYLRSDDLSALNQIMLGQSIVFKL